MDVIGIKGTSNLPPEKEPGSSKKAKGGGDKAAVVSNQDSVTISSDSSRQAESVDRLVDTLKSSEPDRRERLEEIRIRLDAGELDRPEVFRQTAEKILSDI